MTVETATYISQLDNSLPLSSNFVSEGDNHVRLLKEVLQNTFPETGKPFRFPTSHSAVVSADLVVNATTDNNKAYIISANAAQRTVTLPNAPADGFTVHVFKSDSSANGVVIDPSGSTVINENTTFVLANQWEGCTAIYCEALAKWLGLYSPPGVPQGSEVISDLQYLLFAARQTGAGFARKKADNTWTQDQGYASIIQQFGGGATNIEINKGFDQVIPFDCTIIDWTLTGHATALAACTMSVTIHKNTYGAYTGALSGTAVSDSGNNPDLSAANKNTSSTLTNWTTSLLAGDILTTYLDANTDAIKAMLQLRVKRAI